MQIVARRGFYKRLIQNKAVLVLGVGDSDLGAFDVYGFVRQADDSFYEKFSCVIWVSEYDDVISLWIGELVRYFVYDKVISVLKCRHHRASGNYKRLGDEYADGDDDDESYD